MNKFVLYTEIHSTIVILNNLRQNSSNGLHYTKK